MTKFDAEFKMIGVVQKLLLAQNPAQVDDAIEELHERRAHLNQPVRLLPLGGNPKISWDSEGRPNALDTWNNAHHAEMVSDHYVALFERVRNGDDAVIELFQHKNWWQATPRNHAEAISEIARQTPKGTAMVHLLTTEEQPNGIRTASVIDSGIGIHADAFSSGIMATGSSNKVRNPLVAGSYGVGGSTTLPFSEYTIIASRHVDCPEVISFTVALRYDDEEVVGNKGSSFAYYVDENGHAFTALASELPAHLVMTPQDISDSTYDQCIGKIILPRHGTVVRMIGYPLGSYSETWNQMRQLSFGVPIPHGLINGLSKRRRKVADDEEDYSEGNGKHVTFPLGLRHTLNDERRNLGKRSAYKIEFHQPPFKLPMDDGGHITLELWLMDSTTGDHPTQALLPGHALTPIIVSLNGQPHHRLPTKILLDAAGLPYLNNFLIIEINCDGLNYRQRRDTFISNRQQMKVDAEKVMKAKIRKYLDESESLHEWNITFRDRRISGEKHQSSRDLMTRLNSLFQHMQGGATPTQNGGQGVPKAGAGDLGGVARGYIKPIVIHDPPTWIELRRETIEQGDRDAYFVVRTDAADHFDGAVRLFVGGNFLTVLESTSLRQGRESFLVACTETAQIGETAEVYATLTLGDETVLSSTVRTVTVIAPKTEEPRKKSSRNSQPEIIPYRITPADTAKWAVMDDSNLQRDQVAYNFLNSGMGRYDCHINMGFEPFVRLTQQLREAGFRQSILDGFADDYEFDAVKATMISLDRVTPITDMMEVHNWRAAQMTGQLFTRFLWLMDISPRQRKAA